MSGENYPEITPKVPINGLIGAVLGGYTSGLADKPGLSKSECPDEPLTRNNFRLAHDPGSIPACTDGCSPLTASFARSAAP